MACAVKYCRVNELESTDLIVKDAAEWRRWLQAHHQSSSGVWLVMARKGTTEPTTLNYQQALEEALCHGWIDGQARSRDGFTSKQRFTPRRRQSRWSQRNTEIAERLVGEGRMRPAGLAEMERAKADGRWAAAYPGQSSITVPDDLAAALDASPAAKAMFGVLTAQNRYAVLGRLAAAKRPETRARRIETFTAMLARGETFYPQRKGLPQVD
jgi:uncharacterized protein YdeI (YjbR/CyaY-like superfamily)